MEERSKHLEWCKQRANAYVEKNDLQEAFASFLTDMKNHPETANHVALELGMALLLSDNLSSQRQMKEWIDGFN